MERNFRLPDVLSSPHESGRDRKTRPFKVMLDRGRNGSDKDSVGVRVKSVRDSLAALGANLKFRVTKQIRQIVPKGFFDDCDRLLERMFASKFFDDCDKIRDTDSRDRERLARHRARRAENRVKATRVLKRLHKVQAMDLFAMTQHIEPDWFGEKGEQFQAVKALHTKKTRIIWFLHGLYVYLTFDQEVNGWAAKRGFHYRRHRAYHAKVMEGLSERIRQEKWDLKRAKVRARRNKMKDSGVSPENATLYALRRGLGNNVPLPAPILEQDTPEIPTQIKKAIIWDD